MRNENPAALKLQHKQRQQQQLQKVPSQAKQNFIMEFRKLNIYTTAVRRSEVLRRHRVDSILSFNIIEFNSSLDEGFKTLLHNHGELIERGYWLQNIIS